MITLGIIGIVAAMTLPSLLNKAEKLILKNQFKKSYSTLSQALLKTEADLGYKPQCYYNTNSSSATGKISLGMVQDECSILRTAFLKNLNIIATCKNHAYPTCIPKYKGFDTIIADKNPDMSREDVEFSVRGIKGFWQESILEKNPAYALADGSILLDYFHAPMLFAIDINGKKSPNKWGYDVFSFWVGSNEKSNLILIGTSYSVEEGGITTEDMLKSIQK